MNYTTIIFDAFGTLFDTGNGSVAATADILRGYGSGLDPVMVYETWKAFHREIIAGLSHFRLEEDIFREGLARLYEHYGITGNAGKDAKIMLATLGRRKLYADAVPCLQWCRERFHVAIASNTDTAPLVANIERNGVVVDGWFTSESLMAYKPHRDFYRRMLDELACQPHEVIFIGDSIEADVIGPGACGISAIWLNRKKVAVPDIEKMIEISSLEELPAILLSR